MVRADSITMGNERIIWIDSLKGIAILGVIMIHSGGALLPDPLGIVARFGGSGVELFFLISAFLAFGSMERECIQNGGEIVPFKWILKKILGFVPVYYMALFFSVVITGGYSYWYGSEGGITIWNIISHLTLTWGFVPHYCNSIIGGEWYLGTLIIFYVIAPFLFRVINSFERSIAFFIGTTIVCRYVNAFADNRIPDIADTYIYKVYFRDFWIFAQLPVIALGICTFFVLKKVSNEDIREKRLLSKVLLLFVTIMLWGQMNYRSVVYEISESTLIAFWFMLLIISQNIYRDGLINNFIFRMLGEYSYPIYLFHITFIDLFDKWITMSTGYTVLDWGIKYLLIVFISLLFSVVVDKFVDEPYRRMKK